ncbi:MAG: hypothetical protein RLZZ518_1271, partial [Actinomycetota bacterium]
SVAIQHIDIVGERVARQYDIAGDGVACRYEHHPLGVGVIGKCESSGPLSARRVVGA